MGAIKRVGLRAMRHLGVLHIARMLRPGDLRILCYHGAWCLDDGFGGDSLFMRPATFERRIRSLRTAGYRVIGLAEGIAALAGQAEMPPRAVVITIDDGWAGTGTAMLPVLARHGVPATLYCDSENLLSGKPVPQVMARYLNLIHRAGVPVEGPAGAAFARATDRTRNLDERLTAAFDFARLAGIDIAPYLEGRSFGYMTTDELRAAHRTGLDIQLHTHTHSLGDFSPDQIAREIEQNREVLGRVLGTESHSFRHFCFPGGRTAPGLQGVLERLGIESATTLQPRIARRSDAPLMLPRLMDGEHMSSDEFLAELAGIGEILRAGRHRLPQFAGRGSEGRQGRIFS